MSEIREKSRKPDELYQLIELIFPWAQKAELFARNHNLRRGWFSLGNQLGDQYRVWKQELHCDHCNGLIPVGKPRYKAKYKPNTDICQKCAILRFKEMIAPPKPAAVELLSSQKVLETSQDIKEKG